MTANTHHVLTELTATDGSDSMYVRSTVGEALNVVKERTKKKQFNPHLKTADRSAFKKASYKWDLNCDIKKTIELGGAGWSGGQSAMDSMQGEIQHVETSKGKTQTRYNFTGGAPSVGRYLTGQPKHFRQRVRTKRPKLDLYMSISVHCGWSATEFLNRGLAMLKVIERYEDRGYDVNLTANMAQSYYKHESQKDASLIVEIPLKTSGIILDKDLIMFAMAHPAFFRRIGFCFIEYFAPESTDQGYGMPISNNKRLALALESKVLNGNEIYLASDSNNGLYGTVQGAFDRIVSLIEEKITTGKILAA